MASARNTSSSRPTIKGLQEQINELQKQLEASRITASKASELEVLLNAEREKTREYEQMVRTAEQALQDLEISGSPAGSNGPGSSTPIPKPRGKIRVRDVGIPKRLRRRIEETIRDLVIMAQFDVRLDFRHQDVDKLATVFKAANEEHPILARYERNWATAVFIKQYLRNKKKYQRKLEKESEKENRRRSPSSDESEGSEE